MTQSHPGRTVNRTILTITRAARGKEREKERERERISGTTERANGQMYLYIAPTASAVVTLTGHKYTMRPTLAFASHFFFFL